MHHEQETPSHVDLNRVGQQSFYDFHPFVGAEPLLHRTQPERLLFYGCMNPVHLITIAGDLRVIFCTPSAASFCLRRGHRSVPVGLPSNQV